MAHLIQDYLDRIENLRKCLFKGQEKINEVEEKLGQTGWLLDESYQVYFH